MLVNYHRTFIPPIFTGIQEGEVQLEEEGVKKAPHKVMSVVEAKTPFWLLQLRANYN